MAMNPEAIPAILERVRQGEKLRLIAAEFKVTKQALSQYLVHHAEADYRAAQEEYLEEVVETLYQAVLEAPTMTDISRAREAAKVRMWHLERSYPHLYGARQIIQGDKDADPVQVQVVDYTDK